MKVVADTENLRAYCLEKGLSQSDLARHVKMSKDTVQRLFRGLPVQMQTASRIYRAFGDERLKIWKDAPAS